MKEAFYFSHDCNARHDPKITAMRGVYGPEGYGWFWILVEMMREQTDYKLDLRPKYAFHAFASQMQCDVEKAQRFIRDCIDEFELFQSDGDYFWSLSLTRRMREKDEKSEKARQSAQARWEKKRASNQGSDANASDSQCEGEENPCESDAIKEKKVKEKKVNKKINTSSSRHEKTHAEDSPQYRMALYLHQRIMEYAEGLGKAHLVKDANMQKWADDCRKILEIDERDKAEVRQVIDWATSDTFWQQNILSPKKLRDKYPELCLKMSAATVNKTPSGSGGKQTDFDAIQRRLEEKYGHQTSD